MHTKSTNWAVNVMDAASELAVASVLLCTGWVHSADIYGIYTDNNNSTESAERKNNSSQH